MKHLQRALVALLAIALVTLPSRAAIQFDASANGDHYAFGNTEHPQTPSFTWQIRMMCTSWTVGASTFGVLMENWTQATSGADVFAILNNGSGVLTMIIYRGGTPTASTTTAALSTGVNYQIQVAYGVSGTVELYVNGTQYSMSTPTTPAAGAYDDMFFGGGSGQASNCAWEGLKYWSVKLTPTELAAEVNSLPPVKTSNLWDYWRFTSYQAVTYTGLNNSHVLQNLSAGDTYLASDLTPPTAPFISAGTPSGTLATQTTATIGATTDVSSSGTFYAVVDTSANLSGVTAAQVKTAKKASGAAALASCNAAVSTTTPSCGVTGLTAGTAYAYAIIHNTTNGDSNMVTGTFTTQSAASGKVRVMRRRH